MGDLIHIIFVIMCIVLLVYLGYKFIQALTGGQEPAALSNYNALADNLEFMLEKDGSFDSQTMIFYMKKKHYIFGLNGPKSGFSYEQYPVKDCKGYKPCLCFYNKLDHVPSNPSTCRPFDDNVIFHGYFLSGVDMISSYLDPGDLVNFPKHSPELTVDYPAELRFDYDHLQLGYAKMVDLYLEKFIAPNGNIHVLVAAGLSPEMIKQRESTLVECPSTSDELCIGKRSNSKVSVNQFCYYNDDQQKCILQTGITNCAINQKITSNCLCGNTFVDLSQQLDKVYCLSTGGTSFQVLPVNCEAITKCSHYCKAISETASCDTQEQYYCSSDPCKVHNENDKCAFYKQGKRVECGNSLLLSLKQISNTYQ
ncbi:MAG: hypothetical protein KKE98_05715 [Nanoarchaeota archaeon]|nr:hypothetical protein [Nanoarchaeota archaeon]MBU1597915.1 hypothetical protein [Nanoarchaeota archaeon]MBU2442059.1 hypothetical protein [Nanoarchaeota archaeon]